MSVFETFKIPSKSLIEAFEKLELKLSAILFANKEFGLGPSNLGRLGLLVNLPLEEGFKKA